jgi:hypothetical protein
LTPNDVLTSVRAQLYEPSEGFWLDSELFGYMQQAQHELALQVKCTQVATTLTSVTAQSMYTRPVDAFYIDRLTWDKVKLKKIDLTEYDALQRVAYGGMYTIGRSMHYVEWDDQLILWPIPSYSAPIGINYTKIPDTVTASSTFDVPAIFHNMIQDYCLYRAFLKDQDDTRAGFYRKQWDDNLQKAYTLWNRKKDDDRYQVVKEEDSFRTVELGLI